MEDKHDLERFVAAQGESIESVIDELKSGQKIGHWMWYIFPQVIGLGESPMSEYYAIKSKEEAIAYLKHPVLGERLLACTEAVNKLGNLSAAQIFGYPDYFKFCSCMTLFNKVLDEKSQFLFALHKYYDGAPDMMTLAILKSQIT